jgi:adenosylhomocysteine nucleosidase
MAEEVQLIGNGLTERASEEVCGIKFITGRLGGRHVVLAQSGAGKVNAAMTATLLVSHFRPSEVLFSGIAGGLSADLHPGDIVIAARIGHHDCGDITEKGFVPDTVSDPTTGAKLPPFYRADARLLALAQAVAKGMQFDRIRTSEGERRPAVRTGVVVTGDVFIASDAKKAELRKVFAADAVEMEGAAVAQVCARLKVPCLVIRSISDSADAQAHGDFQKFLRAACANSAALVVQLAKGLAAEPAAAAAPAP